MRILEGWRANGISPKMFFFFHMSSVDFDCSRVVVLLTLESILIWFVDKMISLLAKMEVPSFFFWFLIFA